MSEPMTLRHGLEAFLEESAGTGTEDDALVISVCGDLGHINLRGDPAEKKFVAAIEEALGQPLPVTPNTFSSGAQRVFWLGPDEWLITTARDDTPELAARLSDAASGMNAAINDISGGQIALLLEGGDIRGALAKGCTLDLHASVFLAGHCAQTSLAKAGVLLACLDDSPAFMVVVRRSFSDYLCRWLLASGEPGGVRFEGG